MPQKSPESPSPEFQQKTTKFYGMECFFQTGEKFRIDKLYFTRQIESHGAKPKIDGKFIDTDAAEFQRCASQSTQSSVEPPAPHHTPEATNRASAVPES